MKWRGKKEKKFLLVSVTDFHPVWMMALYFKNESQEKLPLRRTLISASNYSACKDNGALYTAMHLATLTGDRGM